MKQSTGSILTELFERYQQLLPLDESIRRAFHVLEECHKAGGMIFVCGNGGSAADSGHIVGELMKNFRIRRRFSDEMREKLAAYPDILACLQPAIPAVSLAAHTELSTAFANDANPDMVFAQQAAGYMRKNDALICLSTSGNSPTVANAAYIARAMGGRVVALTGADAGKLKGCDVVIAVPASQTYRIQELHLPIYHALCAMLEEELFGDDPCPVN